MYQIKNKYITSNLTVQNLLKLLIIKKLKI